MEIREYTNYSEEEIRRLYSEVGWTAYTKNMQALKEISQILYQIAVAAKVILAL